MRIAAFVITIGAFAQIPDSEKLSPPDQQGFQAEIQRLEKFKESASDKCVVVYALARTYAFGGQYGQAINTLRQVIEMNAGIDSSHDRAFKKLENTREYRELIDKARAATPPVI